MEFTDKSKSNSYSYDLSKHPPKLRRYSKRWRVARLKWNQNSVHQANLSTERQYKDILIKIKKCYIPEGTLYFEKDYRNDNSENAFSMHRFYTNNFSIELDCDFLYYYIVLYDFDNCPYEQELQQLIDAYFIELKTERCHHKPSLNAYFDVIRNYQSQEYFFYHRAEAK
ncbi:hypothetical protein [Mucilaginibacter lacusdianchii]|uniref:hypothetical protein n=1 Tax=Mucilaginibacter lacusdianchii TaxID=2684211 RepID=UPI00131B191D|nr:hypothetical protein [Mucilaginibacter sp. JXJ CY 39]